MFETYRMLGQDREVELERLADSSHRAVKPRGRRSRALRARRLTITVRVALGKLTAHTR